MIIGLTGEKLSGKDTVADYLVSKYGAENIRHSHLLDEILDILDLPKSRRNEIDLGMGLRKTFGEGVLGKALAKRVKESRARIVIVNGIRFVDELENARALGAKILYVTAPEETRFQRFLNRKEKADDASQTKEEFRIQEGEPTEIGISKIGEQADFKIVNDGSLFDLNVKIDSIIGEM